jgi:hypothetical protein
MNLKNQQIKELYSYLNLSMDDKPSKAEILRAFEQISLMYETRAAKPITPFDWNAKRILEKAKYAHDTLLKCEDLFRKQELSSFMIDVKEYLYLLLNKKPFTILLEKEQPCHCKKICSRCRAKVTICDLCQGKGWINYCDRCNKTGICKVEFERSFPLGDKLNQYHSWTELDGLISLQIGSYDNFKISELNLIKFLDIDPDQATHNNFKMDFDVSLPPFFSKKLRLEGLENFCKDHRLNLDDTQIKYLIVKPKFMTKDAITFS